jgi:VWFA-related protein
MKDSLVRSCRSIAPAIALASCAAWVSAENQPEQSSRTFYESLQVPLVNVEVVVTDAKGEPIRDLAPADFQVYEDGSPVEITHFSAPDAAAPDAGGAGSPGSEIPEAPDRDVYLALYFDEFNVNPRIWGTAVNQLKKYLAHPLPPNVRTSVVRFNGRLHIECEATRDQGQLLLALERVGRSTPMDITREGDFLVRQMQADAGGQLRLGPTIDFADPSASSGSDLRDVMMSDYLPMINQYASQRFHRNRDSLQGLSNFISYLQGLAGRKVVVWVGSMETRSGENLFRTYERLFPGAARNYGVNSMMDSMKFDVTNELRDMVEYASSQRVSFYPIGALGLDSTVNFDFHNRILEGGGPPGSEGPVDYRANANALQVMAASTGGRTLNDSALGARLVRLSDDLDSAYSLAYRPSTLGDSTYHKIRVQVDREGAVVRHRQGYRVEGTADELPARTVSAALLGITDNPLEIDISTREQVSREDGLFMVPVAVDIPIGNLVLSPEAEQHVARISVVSVVKDDKGRLSDVHQREYPVAISNYQLVSTVAQDATVVLGMVLRKGPHRISVSVRDEMSSIESTQYLDVVVGMETAGPTG